MAAAQHGHERLTELILGFVTAQAIFAAAELDLAGSIAKGNHGLDDLAAATGTQPEPL